jgi:hypothetical protein
MDYDEVGNINSYHLDLAFAGDSVMVSVAERTGLLNAKFVGRRAGKSARRVNAAPGVDNLLACALHVKERAANEITCLL